MDELIGRKFRRNKYGLSTWEDTVREVSIQWELVVKPSTKIDGISSSVRDQIASAKKYGMIAHVKINRIYDLNELVIYPLTA